MSKMNMRRYVFKLHPTAEQARILHEQQFMMTQLWNALKQRHEDTFRREDRSLSYFDMTKEITDLRHQCPEWEVIPAVTSQRVAKHLDDAYKAFYRRVKAGETAGYPKWKRSNGTASIPLGTLGPKGKTGWRFEQRTDNPRSFLLYYKSVCNIKDKTTWIHARGRFPDMTILSWHNADIIRQDGAWWLSICVAIAPRRTAGSQPVMVSFGMIGNLARVDGSPQTPDRLRELHPLSLQLDELKSIRDQQWPRTKRRDDKDQCEFLAASDEIRRLETNIRRRRRDALHVWTSGIIASASSILIEMPKIQPHVRTPKGDTKQWGAYTKDVSKLNRDTLSYASAMAAEMLKYKAEEAGIPCEVKIIGEPEIKVGRDLVVSGQALRRSKRKVKAYVEA